MINESPQQKVDQINFAKCSKGNPAAIVCSSQHCTNKAFVCNDEKCDCRQFHKLCFQLSIANIMKIILAHSFSLEPVAQKIETLFDEAIDKLSDERDKILNQIKYQTKYRYLGLTKLQTKFVQVIKQGAKDDEINCKFVLSLQNEFKGETRINETLNQTAKFIDKMKQQVNKHSIDYIFNLREFLQKIRRHQSFEHFSLKSKIIKTTQDERKLLAFFAQKKVESANLLYRASQNQFLISKWYQKCGNIANTLTIVETEFGKVIGGFTTFKWVRNDQYVSAVNEEKNHFLFSLTNNDKFVIMKNAHNCIKSYSNSERGPGFGGNHDLYIHNKANQNTSSYANPGYTYSNSKYQYNDKDSQVKFGGSLYFKVKQWEVWSVQFSN